MSGPAPCGKRFFLRLGSEALFCGLLGVLSCGAAGRAEAQVKAAHPSAPPPSTQHAPAPIVRRSPPVPSAAPPVSPAPLRPAQRNLAPAARAGKGVPLAQWMDQHSHLSVAEQQRALEHEPGFHELPQPTQERMRQRLSELDNMQPAQRQRILARNEAMSHLSPDQRTEVRGAMQQLGALPPDQRRNVARTFRELRDLPPEQRSSALSSDRYRGQLSDAQRSTLDNLLRVEPMLPPPDRTPR